MAQAFKSRLQRPRHRSLPLRPGRAIKYPTTRVISKITRDGIGILNKHYFAWYPRVTGQNKPAQRRPRPAAATNFRAARADFHGTKPGTKPGTERGTERAAGDHHESGRAHHDSTKLAIYAAAKGIFGETESTDALTW